MRTLSRYLLVITAATLLVPALAAAENGQTGTPPTTTPLVTPSPGVSPSPPETSVNKPAPAQFCARFTDATGKLGSDTTNMFNQLSSSFSQDRKSTRLNS